MDYFKIIELLLFLFILYKLYQNDINKENFESTTNSVDDWTAVNQLAQISKQLMLGGLTVPGALSITGDLTAKGTINSAGNGYFGTGTTKVQLGYSADGACIYATGNDLFVGSSTNKVIVKDNLTIPGGNFSSIQNPDGKTKINAQGIMFGGKNDKGYDVNSAQISAGVHTTDSLCLIGMGKIGGLRKIDMWAEDRVKINGNLNVSGIISSPSTQAIFINATWNDTGFMKEMATFFKNSEPDGTTRTFIIKNESGYNWRCETAIKVGDQIWGYPNLGVGSQDYHSAAVNEKPSGGNDGARATITNP